MAVVTVKSTRISNAESVVQTLDPIFVNHGRKRSVCATVEVTNGDSIGSKFILARVHSSWRITSLKLFCDAITSAAADVGVYQTTANPANGGAVVDVDAYASAASIASASVTGIEVAYEARDIANIQRQVWQDVGLTADPVRWYELVATLTAAATASGTLSAEIEYVAND
jgi:hypothetical protein